MQEIRISTTASRSRAASSALPASGRGDAATPVRLSEVEAREEQRYDLHDDRASPSPRRSHSRFRAHPHPPRAAATKRDSDALRKNDTVPASATREILTLALRAFREKDMDAAGQVEPLEQVIDDLKEQMRTRHILRLQQG